MPNSLLRVSRTGSLSLNDFIIQNSELKLSSVVSLIQIREAVLTQFTAKELVLASNFLQFSEVAGLQFSDVEATQISSFEKDCWLIQAQEVTAQGDVSIAFEKFKLSDSSILAFNLVKLAGEAGRLDLEFADSSFEAITT